jgi:hypothetical protein
VTGSGAYDKNELVPLCIGLRGCVGGSSVRHRQVRVDREIRLPCDVDLHVQSVDAGIHRRLDDSDLHRNRACGMEVPDEDLVLTMRQPPRQIRMPVGDLLQAAMPQLRSTLQSHGVLTSNIDEPARN